jgi:AcrR family transcriptional regulator
MSTVMASNPLPVIGSQTTERADAARNREKILAAAERLAARHGIENVSMDMVAGEAGVGKGTIFRRFGDRATLALALLDEHVQEFQEAFIRGAPPLGPGAPPIERLRAFGYAMIDLLEEHGDLILVGESGSPCARFRSPPFRAHRAHVTSLLVELDPRLDAEYHADSLLAVLAADQYRHLRQEREMPIERVRAGWDSVVAAVEALASR